MRIDRSQLSVSDIAAAYDREMENPPRLLPSNLAFAAVTSCKDEAAAWVHARTGGDFIASPEDTIRVSKSGQGVRPVAIWDFATRLLYGALVLRLGNALRAPDRTHNAWQTFESQPLESAGAYIVSSDITACYDFIDHGLLMEELLVQGGDAAIVENLGSVISGASRRQYGVPQEAWASDMLAEAFLSRLHRVLIRRGLTVSRFSDDFRFTCKSWSDAVLAIEVFSEESRRMGLAMNDSKTITWKRTSYENWLQEADALRQRVADEANLNLTQVNYDEYSDDVTEIPPEPDDVERAAAESILERWSRLAAYGVRAGPRRGEYRAVRELGSLALATLSNDQETNPIILQYISRLLRFERTFTPSFARYLGERDDATMVVDAFDKLLRSRVYLNGWQAWWLQHTVARFKQFKMDPGATRRLRWVRGGKELSRGSATLNAYALLTLARHGATTADEVLATYDRAIESARPTLVAALALLEAPPSIRTSVTSDNPIQKRVWEWASANG